MTPARPAAVHRPRRVAGRARLPGAALVALAVAVACAGCDRAPARAPQTGGSLPPPPPPAERFDAARAFSLLQQQVAFGPRCNGCDGHRRALDWLEESLRALGAETRRQTFTRALENWEGPRTFTNLVARFHPARRPRALLGTHFDTRARADSPEEAAENRDRPIDGANDGASGVAVLLEAARIIAASPPPVGVDIVLFDGEDFGRPSEIQTNYFLGSREYGASLAGAPREDLPRFALVLDMVGDSRLRVPPRRVAPGPLPEDSVLARSQALDDALHHAAARVAPACFGGEPAGEILDDHQALRAAGVPAIVIIDWPKPTWHTLRDTVENCSAASLGGVGRAVLEMVYHPPDRLTRIDGQ
ncbi:MAG: M28 family peptidase [Planctomycetes bacterium]|nr:M28 family peptidase [Planctomycetota bacterium]